MDDRLNHVDERYFKKYFSGRSIFKTYKRYLLKSIIAALILFTLFLAGALAGLVWSCYRLFITISSGDNSFTGVAVIIVLFFLLITAGCIALILVASKSARKPVDHWIHLAAVNCGYSESEIREFEKQVMEPSSLLVPTKSPFAKTFKNGILTRDYICFMGRLNMLEVIKCTDIGFAYLYVSSAPITGTYKNTYSVNLDLIAKNRKLIIGTEVSQKTGNILQETLKEKYPQIDTNDGKVMSEKEYGKWWDDYRSETHLSE